MSDDQAIIALLDAIVRQQRQMLECLTKMAGEGSAQQEQTGITSSRRAEIIQMGYETARSAGKKKSSRGARA